MEGIRFSETPEQARRNAYNNIQAKLRRCEILGEADYDVLREREAAAIEDLRNKLGVI